MSEVIMDHVFERGFCTKCGRKRADLVAYGHPDVKLEPGPTGLSCSGHTNNTEIESLRAAWKRDREQWDKVFG